MPIPAGSSQVPIGSGQGTPNNPITNQPFQPQNPNLPQNIDRGPFPNSKLYNPYGLANAHQQYIGRIAEYGGPNDLLKSINTRAYGINALQQQFQRPMMPAGMMSGIGQLQQGNKLGMEAFQNQQPSLQTPFALQQDTYKASLEGLMNSAYVLGGGIFGGKSAAYAQAKALDDQRKLAHAAAINSILSSVEGGLTGGGGGMGGGMGGGGGGGGGGDYGSGQLSQGLVDIGVANWGW